jgi:hypothetical protein
MLDELNNEIGVIDEMDYQSESS